MPMTPEHLERRKKYLTASDLSAIFNENQFKTAGDVWVEKTMPTEPDEAGEAAEFGNHVEDGLVKFASAKLGKPIKRNQWRVAENGVMAATLDAMTTDDEDGIEAKSAGVYNPFADLEAWGDNNSDMVPMRVLIQCVGQMIACPSLKRVCVPALLTGRRGPQWYVIPRDQALCDAIEKRALAWWQKHVVGGVVPDQEKQGPTVDTLRRVIVTPLAECQLPDDLVRKWRDAKEAAKKAEELADLFTAEVMVQMGEAELGLCNLGKVKRMLINRAGYVVEPTSYRQLRFTKAKEAKPPKE